MACYFINCNNVKVVRNFAGTTDDGSNTIIVYHGPGSYAESDQRPLVAVRDGGERVDVNRAASARMGGAEEQVEEGEIVEDEDHRNAIASMNRALDVMKEDFRNAMSCMNRALSDMDGRNSYYGRDQHQPHFQPPYSGIPCPNCSYYHPNPFTGSIIPGYVLPYYGQKQGVAPESHLHYNYLCPPLHAPQQYVDPHMYTPQRYEEYKEQSPLRSDIDSDEEEPRSFSDEEEFSDEGCIGFHYDEEDYDVPSSPRSPCHDQMDAYDQIPILNVYM